VSPIPESGHVRKIMMARKLQTWAYVGLLLMGQDLPYTLVSDPGLEAARAFHIAFHLDEQHYADQLKWGVDLEKTTGTKNHALPVPSVFIIDASVEGQNAKNRQTRSTGVEFMAASLYLDKPRLLRIGRAIGAERDHGHPLIRSRQNLQSRGTPRPWAC
jgi:hypothetical protein